MEWEATSAYNPTLAQPFSYCITLNNESVNETAGNLDLTQLKIHRMSSAHCCPLYPS